jgi:hypothetical protein
MKNFLSFIFLALIVFMGNLSAAGNEKTKNEPPPPPPYDYDLFKKDTEVVFLNAEFLYWSAQLPHVEYVFKYDRPTENAVVYGLGKYKLSNFKWDPGFRVSIGWFNAPKYWSVYGEFTWIKIDGTNKAIKTSDPIVATFPQLATLNAELSEAKSKISLNYEFSDLVVARFFVPNPHLRLRIGGGFTAGRIKENWNILYTDILDQTEKVLNSYKFLGAGFRVVLDFSWYWGNNVYLTGKATTAPLIGKYRYNSTIKTDTAASYYDLSHFSQYRGAYNIQFLLGPSYQKAFCHTRIEVFAGYELNGWINIHEVNRNSQSTNANLVKTEKIASCANGMLLMDGLSTRISIDF